MTKVQTANGTVPETIAGKTRVPNFPSLLPIPGDDEMGDTKKRKSPKPLEELRGLLERFQEEWKDFRHSHGLIEVKCDSPDSWEFFNACYLKLAAMHFEELEEILQEMGGKVGG